MALALSARLYLSLSHAPWMDITATLPKNGLSPSTSQKHSALSHSPSLKRHRPPPLSPPVYIELVGIESTLVEVGSVYFPLPNHKRSLLLCILYAMCAE